jgi:adenine C2-methylase RlmN of 23S rRNA A2503 and tRNA A37
MHSVAAGGTSILDALFRAWEHVRADLKEQEKDGNIDPVRLQTLAMNIDKAKGRIPEAVKQAYCIVVTVSDKEESAKEINKLLKELKDGFDLQ